MTNQEINERIAKLCGWIPTTDGGICWDSNGNAIITYPNYAESLDACRLFEREYTFGEEELVFDFMQSEVGTAAACFASPELRCEAFLRLKGQWDEN